MPTSPAEPDRAPAEAGSDSGWTYDGAKGPSAWPSLDPQWSACGTPNGQSPVDLPLSALTDKPATPAPSGSEARASEVSAPFSKSKLQSHLSKVPLEATNDGRLIVLAGNAQQTLTIDNQTATLETIELHQPAEHSLGGVVFDLELVLWFSQGDAKPSVALSLLFRKGAANSALAPLIDHLPPKAVYAHRALGAELALSAILPPSESKLLSYWGSTSAPPCTAHVPRLVLAQVGELSTEQLAKLTAASFGPSSRPLQALGDRPVAAIPLASSASDPTTTPSSSEPVAPVTSSTQGPQ